MFPIDVKKKLEKLDVNYKDKLIDFFNEYISYVEKLCDESSNGYSKTIEQFSLYENCTSEKSHMTKALCTWLLDNGFEKFYSACGKLTNEHEKVVLGFIEAYSLLMSFAQDDIMKLIDQLFFIPGQFVRDLVGETEDVINQLWDIQINIEDCSNFTKYEFFNIRESFGGIPCFI